MSEIYFWVSQLLVIIRDINWNQFRCTFSIIFVSGDWHTVIINKDTLTVFRCSQDLLGRRSQDLLRTVPLQYHIHDSLPVPKNSFIHFLEIQLEKYDSKCARSSYMYLKVSKMHSTRNFGPRKSLAGSLRHFNARLGVGWKICLKSKAGARTFSDQHYSTPLCPRGILPKLPRFR